jgi:mannose-1-phosphate guanylyltransferase/phosphomannomutase
LRKKFEHLDRRMVSVPCPWAKKGAVMRKLITGSEDKRRQLIDGVRIFEDNGWVLVIPDRLTAAFKILAESNSKEETSRLIDRYRTLIDQSQSN